VHVSCGLITAFVTLMKFPGIAPSDMCCAESACARHTLGSHMDPCLSACNLAARRRGAQSCTTSGIRSSSVHSSSSSSSRSHSPLSPPLCPASLLFSATPPSPPAGVAEISAPDFPVYAVTLAPQPASPGPSLAATTGSSAAAAPVRVRVPESPASTLGELCASPLPSRLLRSWARPWPHGSQTLRAPILSPLERSSVPAGLRTAEKGGLPRDGAMAMRGDEESSRRSRGVAAEMKVASDDVTFSEDVGGRSMPRDASAARASSAVPRREVEPLPPATIETDRPPRARTCERALREECGVSDDKADEPLPSRETAEVLRKSSAEVRLLMLAPRSTMPHARRCRSRSRRFRS
jgi:hypothetical protein